MSILSVMPNEFWEPADLEDEDDDPPPATACEILTVTGPCGWWSAALANDDDE